MMRDRWSRVPFPEARAPGEKPGVSSTQSIECGVSAFDAEVAIMRTL